MCTCDSERPAFGGLVPFWTVEAAIPHVCVECHGTIASGVQYYPFDYGPVYNTTLDPPRMQAVTDHMCVGCREAWRDLIDLMPTHEKICLGELFICIDTALADEDLEDAAPCVVWRNRFRTKPAEPSWEITYDTATAAATERCILAVAGVPTYQIALPF